METLLKKLAELNFRVLKRLAVEDMELLKEVIALENEFKTRQEPVEVDLRKLPDEPIKYSDPAELEPKPFDVKKLPF